MPRLTRSPLVAPFVVRVARSASVVGTVAASLALAACGGRETATPATDAGATDSSATGGTVIVGLLGAPRSLLPVFVRSEHEQAIAEVVHDRLADIGPDLEVRDDIGFTPRLVRSWQWSVDSLSIRFTLDPRARWHDGTPVSGEDVAHTFALYTDPRVGSSTADLLRNIDSVTAPDAATAVFWFKRRAPQQFYDAVHHMLVMPAHLLRDVSPEELVTAPISRAPVGTGRFRFARWTTDGRVELLADTANFRGRPMLDRVIYETVGELGPAFVRLLAGDIDFLAPLLAQMVGDVATSPNLRLVTYPLLRYQLLTFNLRRPGDRQAPHPVLGDLRTRRALAMATNTTRIVRAVFDTLGQPALGPIPRRALPDPAALRPLPYDTLAARALLDTAGWRPGPDGVRVRDGVRLRVEVMVPALSENRQRMAVLLQDQWRAIGAELVIQRLEVEALITRMEQGRFDAVTNGWALSPGLVGLRQAWRSDAYDNNYGRYENMAVDALVDSMLATFRPARRDSLITRIAQALIDDAPAIWLVEDVILAGVHARLRTGTPSPLGWWSDLPSWSVRPGAQIERDRLGLRSAP